LRAAYRGLQRAIFTLWSRLSVAAGIPDFVHSGWARIHKRNRGPRQPRPILHGLKSSRGSGEKNTAIQRLSVHRGSESPKGSSEPPTHTPDTDLHYSRSNCSPDKGTRYSVENAGASGTTQHRSFSLQRWIAYVTWCSGDLPGLTAPGVL